MNNNNIASLHQGGPEIALNAKISLAVIISRRKALCIAPLYTEPRNYIAEVRDGPCYVSSGGERFRKLAEQARDRMREVTS